MKNTCFFVIFGIISMIMKKIIVFILLLFPLFSYGEDKVTATLFYSTHCKACLKFKQEMLPEIKDKYADKVEWKESNVDEDPDSLALLFSLSENFTGKEAYYPSVFVGNVFLAGTIEIQEGITQAIEIALARERGYKSFYKKDLGEIFKSLSVLTVLGSGLIDGINPCAFAVIVFFVSFLSVYGYKRREVVCMGIFYCFAVFTAYVLIGLGFFKFLYSVRGFYSVIKIFYYFIGGACFFLAGLSLYDYFKFKKTGQSHELILQLPSFFKKRINVVIGSRLREKKERGLIDLAITSFIIGFLVSLLEAVCTGQVYLPTIVFILKTTNLRWKALTYLGLYNLMFILPLVVVFMLSLLGVSSQRFNEFLKRNLGWLKILMALVFCVLGGFIIWIS